jgi:Transposase, Mutator family
VAGAQPPRASDSTIDDDDTAREWFPPRSSGPSSFAAADRGLHGVQLVISDHHRGLENAIGAVMVAASWQRCRVHYADFRIMPLWMGNLLQDRGFLLARLA